jgi:hypothetical protein
VVPTFIADRVGTFIAQLVVSDGLMQSAPDTVHHHDDEHRSGRETRARIQAAVAVSSTVTLDGSASADADGQPLTTNGRSSAGQAASAATLTNATVVAPTFVPDVAGDYVAQLIVNDGFVSRRAGYRVDHCRCGRLQSQAHRRSRREPECQCTGNDPSSSMAEARAIPTEIH